MYLETVADLAAHLADLLDIYNRGIHFVGMTPTESRDEADWLLDHHPDCICRGCWTGMMERRIRAAVANDAMLARAANKEGA